MAASLPLELLFEIATLLRTDGASLIPCTHVCRYWQSALEPLVYTNIAVYSDSYHKEKGRRGISLTHFQKLTSGSRSIRRNWIRKLEYDIIVPCKLLDWTTSKSSDYSTDNQLRQANDFAFQTAIFDLFQTLHSWNQRCRLSLHLGLRESRHNRWPKMEPDASHCPTASAYRSFDRYTGTRNIPIPPYRARFVNNMPELYLVHVPCIDTLTVTNRSHDKNQLHQIWTGAIQTIIEHCPTLTELELDLNEWVRPDYLQYIQGRRACKLCRYFHAFFAQVCFTNGYIALGSLLGSIPSSLRVFRYKGAEDGPWKHTMPALNVVPSGIDSTTINLRNLSNHLRELKLNRTTLPFDFLCPLDGEGQPIIGSLYWPYLRTLEIEDVPPWLPSGKEYISLPLVCL